MTPRRRTIQIALLPEHAELMRLIIAMYVSEMASVAEHQADTFTAEAAEELRVARSLRDLLDSQLTELARSIPCKPDCPWCDAHPGKPHPGPR